jgi:hypothetical protein
MTFRLNVVVLVEEVHWFQFEYHELVMMVGLLDYHHHHHLDQERLNQLLELLNLVELVILED